MLEAKNITKRFGGHAVLQGADLSVTPGEVVGLVGMNGSGKTTLLDILSGKTPPDEGEVWVDGHLVGGKSAKTNQARIFRTYQVPRLFFGLSIENNINLGVLSNGSRGTASLRDFNNLELNAYALSIGQRRRVILDWVASRIGSFPYFLLDEPAAGADSELVERLMGLIDDARNHDTGILLVEHRNGVLKNTCDRILTLRNGKCLKNISCEESPINLIISSTKKSELSKKILVIENVSIARGVAKIVDNVTLNSGSGEVSCVTGGNGCGKSTLLSAIYGTPSCRILGGRILFDGEVISSLNIDQRIAKGIHLMPQNGGLFQSMSVEEFLRTGLDVVKPNSWNDKIPGRLFGDIPHLETLWGRTCGLLSGGERKLVALARIILLTPKLVLLDEPLAGVDASSRKLVLQVISRLKDAGAAVIIVEQESLVHHFSYDRLLTL